MSASLEARLKRVEPVTTTTTKKKKVTNANTDRLCLDDNSSILGRLWYHLSLHNGLYLLDPTEKVALNTAGALFTVLTILYLWSFGRGFVDGFANAGPYDVVGQQQQQPLPQQQQETSSVHLDPTGSGGIRNYDLLLSDGLSDAAANAAASVDPSMLASSSATSSGAASEL
jgi:hypothetical protein